MNLLNAERKQEKVLHTQNIGQCLKGNRARGDKIKDKFFIDTLKSLKKNNKTQELNSVIVK